MGCRRSGSKGVPRVLACGGAVPSFRVTAERVPRRVRSLFLKSEWATQRAEHCFTVMRPLRCRPFSLTSRAPTMTDSRTMWVITAVCGFEPHRGNCLDLWRKESYCSVGYIEVGAPAAPDLDSNRKLFADAYNSGRRSPSTNGGARQLHVFANEMALGDLVIARGPSADIHLGVVTGQYRYEKGAILGADPHRHRRDVRWLHQIPRTADLANAVHSPATIRPSRDVEPNNHRSALIAAFGIAEQWLNAPDAYMPAPTDIAARPVYDDGKALADAHSEHNKAQNELSIAAVKLGLSPCCLPEGPAVDLSLIGVDGRRTICEVKSINGGNDTEQLRVGLGQILDYLDQLIGYERGVSGLLWTSRRPVDADRWSRLCARHGVALGWLGREHILIDPHAPVTPE